MVGVRTSTLQSLFRSVLPQGDFRAVLLDAGCGAEGDATLAVVFGA
jgi:hypothetical protein